jgi:hypothetical protein
MNHVLDHVLVGALVLGGFGYAVYSLGPKGLRVRMRLGAARACGVLPAFMGLGGAAQRLAATAVKASGACGGCDNCGPEHPTMQPSSPDVQIPLSTIGRRR